MNSKELLPISESLPQTNEAEKHLSLKITLPEIESLFAARLEELEQIKELMSLKFYYAVKEKIGAEKEAFLKLLDLEGKKKAILSDYSFALDTHFFEQRFLPTTH